MATRKTDFIAKHLLFSNYWKIWTDLTQKEIKTIEGVAWVSNTGNPRDIKIDERYGGGEVIAEIKVLAEARAIKC